MPTGLICLTGSEAGFVEGYESDSTELCGDGKFFLILGESAFEIGTGSSMASVKLCLGCTGDSSEETLVRPLNFVSAITGVEAFSSTHISSVSLILFPLLMETTGVEPNVIPPFATAR